MMHLIQPEVRASTAKLRDEFANAQPFRHVVVDDFLDGDFCERLMADFPAYDRDKALDETGKVGLKAVVPDIGRISPAYAEFDRLMRSADLLRWMGEITSIEHLLYDPEYVGGGTHENLHGQDLDAHVDFNYHPKRPLHRRLNLILFLNPEWKREWGGCLELDRDPWNPGRRFGGAHCSAGQPVRGFRNNGNVLAWIPSHRSAGRAKASIAPLAGGLLLYEGTPARGDRSGAQHHLCAAALAGAFSSGIHFAAGGCGADASSAAAARRPDPFPVRTGKRVFQDAERVFQDAHEHSAVEVGASGSGSQLAFAPPAEITFKYPAHRRRRPPVLRNAGDPCRRLGGARHGPVRIDWIFSRRYYECR